MENTQILRQNMISATKELAKNYSLEDLNLIVTDTVLGWVLEDLTREMESDSREYSEQMLSRSELELLDAADKELTVRHLWDTYQEYSFFSELSVMRGNVFEENNALEERVVSILQEENYIASDSHPPMRKYITLSGSYKK